ncbi:iron-molybdenum cofactor-binding protein [Candidatus Bathyarchaeota archaeon]|nr:iron-molybdenum cofactor-binding protein [Candidatus Bathyarchaeota archaeon]
MRIAIPTEGKRKLSNKVADTFSRTSKFTIVTIKDSKIDSVELISNPGETPERGAGPLAARALKENNVDLVLTGEMGPGAKNILDALNIEIKLVEQGKSVKEVVSPYIESG